MTGEKMIRIAAVLGALAVITGAFGAHTLKPLLSAEHLAAYETGVRYHFYHTLALLACGILYRHHPSKQLRMAASSFLAGIILFSGSVYLLSTREITGAGFTGILGPVAPLGGMLFILGWIFLFLSIKPLQQK
jgi:uncharacterized membrane protein YgdD (TMEM256/DUF423 family)